MVKMTTVSSQLTHNESINDWKNVSLSLSPSPLSVHHPPPPLFQWQICSLEQYTKTIYLH